MTPPILLSIVIPAFNESANLPHMVGRLRAELGSAAASVEIIVVDDGSTDATARVATQIVPAIRLLRLSRNFGKESALAAGMQAAQGQGVLFIDADLQHPPELIPSMVSAWRAGADVVNAVKRSRGQEATLNRWGAGAFNHVMSRLLNFSMAGASDYKLLDRKVVAVLLACPERVRFFRGLVAWAGFSQVDVQYDVAPRHGGHTSWSQLALLRYSLRNLLAFTSSPLYWVAMVGFIMSIFSFLVLLQTLYGHLFGNSAVGFTTVIALQVILGGIVLSALGIIAAYVALIYEELKQRPLFLVNNPQQDPADPPQ